MDYIYDILITLLLEDLCLGTAGLAARNSAEEDIEWITVKGNHIPIKKGQTKEEAVKEWVEKKQAGKTKQEPTTDGIVRDVIKEVQKAIKEANCESTEPAEYYPKTIAGVKRGKPMTFAQADNGRANPHYNPKNPAYYRNCQSCVVAHEARMRGYDVQAAPRGINDKTNILAYHSSWAWIDSKTGKKCEYVKIPAKNANQLQSWLVKNIKPNERYQFAYNWTAKNGELKGHVVILMKDSNNKPYMYDPQVNKLYLEDNFKNKISKITYNYSGKQKEPRILRTDDKKFNPYFMNEVLKKY